MTPFLDDAVTVRIGIVTVSSPPGRRRLAFFFVRYLVRSFFTPSEREQISLVSVDVPPERTADPVERLR